MSEWPCTDVDSNGCNVGGKHTKGGVNSLPPKKSPTFLLATVMGFGERSHFAVVNATYYTLLQMLVVQTTYILC